MALPSFPGPAEASHEDGFIASRDGARLYWTRWSPPSPRATVAVVPGGGEHTGRYPALTSALVRAGFEVEIVDLRGHGRSDGRRWHIDAFGDYLADADAFLSHARASAGPRPTFVLGHSQGALVVARWALEPGHGAAGVVLSSAFLRLKLTPPRLKLLAARAVGAVVPWLPMSTGLDVRDLTTDEEMQRWTDADPLYGRKTTPRWFVESQRAQQEVLGRARAFALPLLVMAGEADPIADPAAMRSFCEAAGSADKTFTAYPGFRHELFNERERDRAIGDAVRWIAARAAP